MESSVFFGLLSGIIALVAYGFYFKQILKSQSTPNPASWLIWLVTGLINAFTYFSITHGNIPQTLIVLAVLFSTFTIFVYSLIKGKFTKISHIEIVIFALAIGIGIFWQTTSNDRAANLFLQGIYLVSYVPTVLGVLRGSARENPTSWSIILLAYVFSTLSVIYGPHEDWVAFANPLINGLLGTGSAVLAIFYSNSRKSRS